MRTQALLFIACAFTAHAQPGPGALPQREVLHYNVEWRLITAGKARIDWNTTSGAQPGWQLKMHLESVGLVSKLFKVRSDYTAQLDRNLCAQSMFLDALEGKRHRETRVTFEGGKAMYRERDLSAGKDLLTQETEAPPCVHDVPGGLYLLRTMRLEPGQSTQVTVSDGKKHVSARVEAQQREEIKTPSGTYKTIRYEVFLFNDVLYRRPAHLYVWLSDDARRLPVQIRVRMQITIGTITLQLEKIE